MVNDEMKSYYKAIKRDYHNYESFPIELRNNEEFVIKCVEFNPNVSRLISQRLMKNTAFAMKINTIVKNSDYPFNNAKYDTKEAYVSHYAQKDDTPDMC